MFSKISISLFLLSLILSFTLSCNDSGSTEPKNFAPKIQGIYANSDTIKVNERTDLWCDAIDQDGTILEVNWSCKYGLFPNGSSRQDGGPVTWEAPDTPGVYILIVNVTDWIDTVSDSLVIFVKEDGCAGIDKITYQGKVYNTVEIGSQCWLKENLNVGIMIISNDSSDLQTNNEVIEKNCYDNDENNCDKYGGLYQWEEAMRYGNDFELVTQGLCPNGWHIPTNYEFKFLKQLVTDGNTLKEVGEGTDDGAGNNSSGFSALLTGFRHGRTGGFEYLSTFTFFWSSEDHNQKAYYFGLSSNSYHFRDGYDLKSNGFSIRCIKD